MTYLILFIIYEVVAAWYCLWDYKKFNGNVTISDAFWLILLGWGVAPVVLISKFIQASFWKKKIF